MNVLAERLAPAVPRRLARWVSAAGIVLFGVVVLLPNWIVLPPDDEGFWMEIVTTAYQARELFSGNYPLWDPGVGLGVPQPGSETLVFHPFLVLVHALPAATAVALFYELQFLVGLLAAWGVARHLGIRRWIAGLCVLTYALSSPTLAYLRDFWPVVWLQWTLAPLLLLLLLRLLDAEERWARAAYALAVGLCTAFFMLDGHAGVVVDFAIPFLAFLAPQLRRLRALLPWLGVSLLVILLAYASRVYDLWLETRPASEHTQQHVAFDWWRFFFYPIDSGFHESTYRHLAVGGPVVILMLVGLLWRSVSGRVADGLRAAVVAAFVLWFLPLEWIPTRSANFFAGNALIVFGVPLAGLALQTLWERLPRLRPAVTGLVVLQVVALVAGYSSFYVDNFRRAIDYLDGKPVLSLRDSFKNQPVYRFFEQRPGIDGTRVYMASGAEERLWRALETRDWRGEGVTGDYEYAGWWLHDLRLVNGHFRGTDISELRPTTEALHGEIRAEPTFPRDPTALDVLNIGYVLAKPGERVAPTLRRIGTFHLSYPTATIVAYANPAAWPDAVALQPRAREIKTLPARQGCEEPGLLCASFDRVAALHTPALVRDQRWRDTDLVVGLSPARTPHVLMLSQLYRPGWRARLSNGDTVAGYRLFGGLTGFDLPPGVTSARIVFDPPARIALTALTWSTLFAGLAALAVCAVLARRASRQP